jgi:hypothetical protein
VLPFRSPYYNISVTDVTVGNKTFGTKFSVVVDSGTSFTALSDPMYTEITTSVTRFYQISSYLTIFTISRWLSSVSILVQFNAQAKEKKNQPDSSLPFEFCYTLR